MNTNRYNNTEDPDQQEIRQSIAQIIEQDYQRFPADQTYSIYASDVYFKDPLNQFRGLERYKQMIAFINRWFLEPHLDLQHISHSGDTIRTRWTLSWTTPLPWKPRMTIPGWSELKLNAEGLIVSHIDYWDCSRLDVLKQLLYSNVK
ncbi:MAG: DUF2358 domain-containing protein [Moorea sp. SIO1G6]|uniref:DUF2358 domain-containing protein n=1 Tax=Moorena producens (strain JHB) TaxID=1454205 RepID=A0A1D9G6R2_MOOP1|nr:MULTISPECIES: DUF2358 domain-containing protein [Moorena]AOY83241.1 DUF2358 domain-containing protein [Moorena producens JHB]NET67558.1 DUF2358 domain-containing protein [Moorena sp. SIO1G6]